jgi:hypothetical protein
LPGEQGEGDYRALDCAISHYERAGHRAHATNFAGVAPTGDISVALRPRKSCSQERDGGEHMNAETETAIQNLSKAFADTAETMKRIANSLVNIELHLQAMRPSNMQTVRGPSR